MCERCEVKREQLWAEIRDILNYNRKVKGPVSIRMAERFAKLEAESEVEFTPEHRAVMVEGIRAEMIAMRCAQIVQHCPETRYHGEEIHDIMGTWAGTALQAALQHGGIVGILFIGDGENEEDE